MSISFIIPVFNGENTLVRCVNSVLRFNLHDIEIIIVNDGSTDGTSQITKAFSKFDNVIVKNQINSGVSVARNSGMLLASKKFIYFIDCDDYLVEDFDFSYVVKILDTQFPDILFHGITIDFWQKNSKVIRIQDRNFNELLLEDKLRSIYNSGLFNYPVCKFWKREFILKNKLFFCSQHKIGEDFLFNIAAFKRKPLIVYIDEIGYIYEKSNTITATSRYYSNYLEIKLFQLRKFEELITSMEFSNLESIYRIEKLKTIAYIVNLYFKYEAIDDFDRSKFALISEQVKLQDYLRGLKLREVNNVVLLIIKLLPIYLAHVVLSSLFKIRKNHLFSQLRKNYLAWRG